MEKTIDVGAREGLSDYISSKSLSHRKSVKLQKEINTICDMTIINLHKSHKVKEIHKQIYSYQIDKNSRFIIREVENGIIILDYIDLQEMHTSTHIDFIKLFYRFFKRLTDIIISIFAIFMLVIISVILIPAIKIESRGPITFSQVRVGKNGKRFKMYKFRSMYTDYESRMKNINNLSIAFNMNDDPRITKVGRFIRRYCIDEFPIFLNVLKGDMSIIGPRPPMDKEYMYLTKVNNRISSVKPGIVGLTQLRYTELRNFEEIVQFDLDYITNMSNTLDFRIMFKTICEVSKIHSLTEIDDKISHIIIAYAN